MSEITVFECDVTGERFGAKNDVYEYELRRRRTNSPFECYSETVHVSDAAFEDADLKAHYRVPSVVRTEYIGVTKDEEGNERVAGIMIEVNGTVHWYERDHTVVDSHVPFFEFLEEEVLY